MVVLTETIVHAVPLRKIEHSTHVPWRTTRFHTALIHTRHDLLLDYHVVLISVLLRAQWIRLVDFYSGKCLAKVAGHSELATGVRFTPDGRRLVTTGGEGPGANWWEANSWALTVPHRWS